MIEMVEVEALVVEISEVEDSDESLTALLPCYQSLKVITF